jgi:hypothetical protein
MWTWPKGRIPIQNPLPIVFMKRIVIITHYAIRMFLVDTHDSFDKVIRIPNVVVDEEYAIILVSGLEDFMPLMYIGILWKPV